MGSIVVIFDTDIFLVMLKVPGYDQAGPDNDKWTSTRIKTRIGKFEKDGADFVIPIASLIETGNHIVNNKRKDAQVFVTAKRLSAIIRKAANDENPWTAFRAQTEFLTDDRLIEIAKDFPELAKQKISLGDHYALKLVDYYRSIGSQVYLWTGDQGLQEQEPPPPPAVIPRRER